METLKIDRNVEVTTDIQVKFTPKEVATIAAALGVTSTSDLRKSGVPGNHIVSSTKQFELFMNMKSLHGRLYNRKFYDEEGSEQ